MFLIKDILCGPVMILVFLRLCENCHVEGFEARVVPTENGLVRGYAAQTHGGNKDYFAFQGIPYAQPPVGQLRFKAPVKATNWTGVLNATQDKTECVQNTNPVTGSEDCLYINVYTPNVTDFGRKILPVMVWIHGGAFIGGNSSYLQFAPDFFLEEDVVFVSFNYRLGVFGFLSTEDIICPGNWGLKDQVLALQWVQTNIQYFGGDPTKVTIFGESAGSASVSYLLQTKRASGLFRSAIMESGVSLCLWSLSRKARAVAFQIGKNLQVQTTNSKILLESLREISHTKLQEISKSTSLVFLLENALAGLVFTPVIEPIHEDALFYNKSHELLRTGNFNRVPAIIGINSNEAAALGRLTLIFRTYIFSRYDLNAALFAPADLNSNPFLNAIAGSIIKLRYFGLLPASTQNSSVVQFISDDQFNRPVMEAVIQQSKYAPVYFYIFSFEGLLNKNNGTFKGVGHALELPYLFTQGSSEVVLPNNDITTKRRMVRLWTNFAKYSNPTPYPEELFQNTTWPIVDTNNTGLVYLDIGSNLTIEKDPFQGNMNFYQYIYKQYGSLPHDTY